jgi:transglutaminase-like putative cysteine protease
VGALADNHLISAGQPVRWQLADQTSVRPASSGVVLLPEGLQEGQRYTVWSYAPNASPDELIELPPEYPPEVQRYLEILPGVPLPTFGAVDREATVENIFEETDRDSGGLVAGKHAGLYRQAQDVAGSAPTPYAVALALEQWFRNTGGFSYNEIPASSSGAEPPLVEFVLQGRQGYCQHYAGSMALMLRMLGVPARVAAGFVSGTLDEATGVWTITDRDAHTWVEVWFPEFGWLSFDPTPGRGSLDDAYTVSSGAFDLSAEGAGAVAGAVLSENDELAEIFGDTLSAVGSLGNLETPPVLGVGEGFNAQAGTATGDDGVFSPWATVMLIVLAVVALLVALKLVWRRLRLRARDPRRVSAVLRRDVIGFLADQGLTADPSLTLQELGGCIAARYQTDPRAFVDAASAARFGPTVSAQEAARCARDEHTVLIAGLRGDMGRRARVRGTFSTRSLRVPRAALPVAPPRAEVTSSA